MSIIGVLVHPTSNCKILTHLCSVVFFIHEKLGTCCSCSLRHSKRGAVSGADEASFCTSAVVCLSSGRSSHEVYFCFKVVWTTTNFCDAFYVDLDAWFIHTSRRRARYMGMRRKQNRQSVPESPTTTKAGRTVIKSVFRLTHQRKYIPTLNGLPLRCNGDALHCIAFDPFPLNPVVWYTSKRICVAPTPPFPLTYFQHAHFLTATGSYPRSQRSSPKSPGSSSSATQWK